MQLGHNPATDYGTVVINALARMTRESKSVDQNILRHYIGLSSSYLLTDTSMNPERGMTTWTIGFNRLVDVVVALHGVGELEFETVNQASRACSECWTVAGSWRGLDEARETVRGVATKLKKLLDENGKTYKGEKVYTPT
jgi:hypothetical protein